MERNKSVRRKPKHQQRTLSVSPNGHVALSTDALPPRSPAARRLASHELRTKPLQGLYIDRNKPREERELSGGESLDGEEDDEEPRLEGVKPDGEVLGDHEMEDEILDEWDEDEDVHVRTGPHRRRGRYDPDEVSEDDSDDVADGEPVATRLRKRASQYQDDGAMDDEDEGAVAPVASGSGIKRNSDGRPIMQGEGTSALKPFSLAKSISPLNSKSTGSIIPSTSKPAPRSFQRTPSNFTIVIPLPPRRKTPKPSNGPPEKAIEVVIVSSSDEQETKAVVKSSGGRRIVVDSEDEKEGDIPVVEEDLEIDLGPIPYSSALKRRQQKENLVSGGKGKNKDSSPLPSPPASKSKPPTASTRTHSAFSSSTKATYKNPPPDQDSSQDERQPTKKKRRASSARSAKTRPKKKLATRNVKEYASSDDDDDGMDQFVVDDEEDQWSRGFKKSSTGSKGKGKGRAMEMDSSSSSEDEREKKRKRDAKGKGKARRPSTSDSDSDSSHGPQLKTDKKRTITSSKAKRREESDDDLELSGKETVLQDRLRVITPKNKYEMLRTLREKRAHTKAKVDEANRSRVIPSESESESDLPEDASEEEEEVASESLPREEEDLEGFIVSNDEDEQVDPEVTAHMDRVRQKSQGLKYYSYLAWVVHNIICPDIEFLSPDNEDQEYKAAYDALNSKINGTLSSLIRSQAWRVPFKRALDLWPEFAIDDIPKTDRGLPCDACAMGKARNSMLVGTFTGEKYNRETFGPLPAPDSDSPESDSDDPPAEFNLGSACAGRAQGLLRLSPGSFAMDITDLVPPPSVYHELYHQGYWFHQQLLGKVARIRRNYPKPSYAGMDRAEKKKAKAKDRERRLVEASRCVEVLEAEGVIPKIANRFLERVTQIEKEFTGA